MTRPHLSEDRNTVMNDTDRCDMKDPRIATIVKKLLAWEDTEFDADGKPCRADLSAALSEPRCVDTILDLAVHALADMEHWARRGRALDAEKDLDSATHDDD